jgi:hypothetical protein
MARDYYSAMGDHLRGLTANALGVTVQSLHSLRVGWSAEHRATTWPMTDAAGAVRGIRLRGTDGRKWSVRGGREGLFIPEGLHSDQLIVICEGATDAAALVDLDFYAVGRPSCSGGVGLLVELIQCDQPHNVAIIADADVPGQRGARGLAARLCGYVPGGIRIVTPPKGAKDARDWSRLLGSSWEHRRLEIQENIEAAPVMTLTYSRRAVV